MQKSTWNKVCKGMVFVFCIQRFTNSGKIREKNEGKWIQNFPHLKHTVYTLKEEMANRNNLNTLIWV